MAHAECMLYKLARKIAYKLLEKKATNKCMAGPS
jgi:hypothetical protein